MPNFTSTLTQQVVNNDGSKLVKSESIGSNGKVIFDDILDPGVFDVGALLGELAEPQFLQIQMTDTSGFAINLEALGASTILFTSFSARFEPTGSNPVLLTITTTVQSRVQIYALGDSTP